VCSSDLNDGTLTQLSKKWYNADLTVQQ